MALQRVKLFERSNIKQPDHSFSTRGSDEVPIGTPSRRVHYSSMRMPAETISRVHHDILRQHSQGRNILAHPRIPKLNEQVLAPAHNQPL